jgi:hypothetical protein
MKQAKTCVVLQYGTEGSRAAGEHLAVGQLGEGSPKRLWRGGGGRGERWLGGRVGRGTLREGVHMKTKEYMRKCHNFAQRDGGDIHAALE